MEQDGALRKQLDDFVTIGGNWAISGDITARDNEMLKMAVFGPVVAEIAGRPAIGNSASIAILSDEGPSLGGKEAAPLPLQYFLAGIAF